MYVGTMVPCKWIFVESFSITMDTEWSELFHCSIAKRRTTRACEKKPSCSTIFFREYWKNPNSSSKLQNLYVLLWLCIHTSLNRPYWPRSSNWLFDLFFCFSRFTCIKSFSSPISIKKSPKGQV